MQQSQTKLPIQIDIAVINLGQKPHLRRSKRIILGEGKVQFKDPSFIGGMLRPHHHHLPLKDIRWVGEDPNILVRVLHKQGNFLQHSLRLTRIPKLRLTLYIVHQLSSIHHLFYLLRLWQDVLFLGEFLLIIEVQIQVLHVLRYLNNLPQPCA